MQLKMSKPFDRDVVKKLLKEETIFISEIFLKMPFPLSELGGRNNRIGQNRKALTKAKIVPKLSGKVERAQTFEELHARLERLKNVKRLGYKQKQVKKNLKNKIKKISKRKERLIHKKLVKTEENASSGEIKIKKEDDEALKVPKPKPVFNSESKMVFSKFDFSEIGAKKKAAKSKDPKKLLIELKQKKEKLKEMEEAGEKEKVQEIKEKEAWKAALAKAGGKKVKDDPTLLKQTIKRKEVKKKHSSKKWESRLEQVQKGLKQRQEKRQENIMKRKKEKKVNKLKKAAKKGRVIPGF